MALKVFIMYIAVKMTSGTIRSIICLFNFKQIGRLLPKLIILIKKPEYNHGPLLKGKAPYN
jgi:hypothetical protein